MVRGSQMSGVPGFLLGTMGFGSLSLWNRMVSVDLPSKQYC